MQCEVWKDIRRMGRDISQELTELKMSSKATFGRGVFEVTLSGYIIHHSLHRKVEMFCI